MYKSGSRLDYRLVNTVLNLITIADAFEFMDGREVTSSEDTTDLEDVSLLIAFWCAHAARSKFQSTVDWVIQQHKEVVLVLLDDTPWPK